MTTSAVNAESSSPTLYRTALNLVQAYGQQLGLLAVIAVLSAVFQSVNPVFLSPANVIEMLRAGALYFVVACPSTLVLVAGGLDFSVGALFAVGGIVAGAAMMGGVPWPLAMLLGVGAGGLLGLVNGAITVYLRVPPLIATLGTFFAATGFMNVYTGGSNLFGFPPDFNNIGQGDFLGIPFLVYYSAVTGVIFYVLLEKTRLGYNSRCLGGNRSAASANGIRVNALDLTLYAISGAVTALAGIFFMARTSTASPGAGGSTLTFQVITAIIIGGTSLFGGIGTITGTLLGTLLFAVINNGLAVVNVNALYQNIFIGVILVGAVAIDQASRRRQFTSGRR